MICKIILAVVALTLAAYCEVKGDTVLSGAIEKRNVALALGGFGLLCLYGVLVNAFNGVQQFTGGKPWKFSELLGVYITFFAAVNLCLESRPPLSMKIGTLIIALGGIVIQWGAPVSRWFRGLGT
jgi:hypothetical protein